MKYTSNLRKKAFWEIVTFPFLCPLTLSIDKPIYQIGLKPIIPQKIVHPYIGFSQIFFGIHLKRVKLKFYWQIQAG
jgi:hypothetical protein